jgi:aspartate-semialdehyde dehydrogenase
MEKDVPLVVPEVNPEDILWNNGIISNPNCSTIQAVVPLKPLDERYRIKRIVYSTYQAVSGAGRQGIEDLENGAKGIQCKKFPYQIFNNCLPQIDVFLEDGYTKEEYKMINETKKILGRDDILITATAVRVPVKNCHAESINVEFENEIDLNEIVTILKNAPGVIIADDIKNSIYPLASNVDGNDNVFVGRIRRDFSIKNGINLWVVADNIRKGAASNAVQIIEKLLEF